ncbi:MAG: DUF885 domain-containing protein [Actinomycetota bacterium]
MDETNRTDGLVDRYWDELLELEPTLGTSVGDERHDDRLPDPGEVGRAASEAAHRATLAEASTIDRSELDPSRRTTLDVAEAIARRFLAELEHRTDRLSAANHLWGPGQMLGEIASVQQADTPERLERYEARLRAFPAFLEAWAEVGREGVATGVTAPRVVAERTIAQIERLLALPAHESPALMPITHDEDRSRIAAIVGEVVNPAYEAFLGALREYLPHATESLGLSSLPGGEAMYATAILSWTSLPLDPRELHDLGNARFDAIVDERDSVAGTLGYASSAEALAAYHATGADTAESPEALVAIVEDQVRRSWDAAGPWFGQLPSANCEVRVVEAFREADCPIAFYNPPTEDGSRPGVYYINTYDLPGRELHSIPGVTFHEANPGHHFQVALEQEANDLPKLRRFGGILAGSAFTEGWGLYAERLADEMGLYLDDWERLGMLENQALRAARLITDTGLHALGWDRERAIAKLQEGGTPRTDAEIEIDRYIAMPAQALSYMTGMIEIEKARAAEEAKKGAAFSLPDFHDRLLALGTVPLPSLAREFGS